MKRKIRLTHADYKKILKYYKITFPQGTSFSSLKKKLKMHLLKKYVNVLKN